jgi:phosphoglycolate phosphatase
MKKNINTIIFDLDGTLLNTLDDLHACFNYAIKSFGYPERTLDEIRSFVGNGMKTALKRALPDSVCDEELNKIVNFFRPYYKENMLKLTKPYDGVVELLKTLKEKGYKIAVVSNKYDEEVKNLCKNFFGEYIDIAIGESDDVRKKPEIDGVLKALKELNSTLEESIFIGDSDVDILTARNANIPCISVLWGFRDKAFLENKGGKFFAKTTKDIENFLYLG